MKSGRKATKVAKVNASDMNSGKKTKPSSKSNLKSGLGYANYEIGNKRCKETKDNIVSNKKKRE
jgi:hypothetical protein